MPSLRPGTPGAKEAFGVSIMSEHAAITIPPAVLLCYELTDGSAVILATGHRKESGFALMNKERAEKSVFKKIVRLLEQDNKVYWLSEKAYVLAKVHGDKIFFNADMLAAFYLQIGMKLMIVKSTTVASSFTPIDIWAEKLTKHGFADAAANIAKLPVFD